MSKTLDRIKEISENLSGAATVKEYHVLRKLDEQLSKYEMELILKNFSLDYDTALCEVSMELAKNNMPMPQQYKTFCLAAPLIFSEDSNDQVEIFAVFPPRKRITLGVCVYELKKENSTDDSIDSILEKRFSPQYGKIKLAECEWCKPAPKRNEELSKFIPLIETIIKSSFKKAEDGMYITTLPYVNSLNEFKKRVMPKIQGIYDVLKKWD